MDQIDVMLDQQIELAKRRRERLYQLATLQDEIDKLTTKLIVSKSDLVTKEVVAISAAFFGVANCAILSRVRTPKAVEARQAAMFILHYHCHMSYSEIGRLMKRDHSTVLHGLKTMRNRIDTEPLFRQCLEEVTKLTQLRIKEIA